jgi:phospholipase/lecithinase/hemolysin
MRQFLTQVLAMVVCTCAVVSAAAAQGAQRIVFFGDSLSDAGNNFIFTRQSTKQPFPLGPAAFSYDIGGHHYSNGATWAEQLSTYLGLPQSGKPSLRQPGMFTNYAVGDARTRAGAPAFPYFDLTTQVTSFLNDFGGRAPGDTLYVIWMGANDLNDALNALAANPDDPAVYEIPEQAIAAITSNIATLYASGAQRILVISVPDLGETPYLRYLGAHVNPLDPLIASAFTYGFDAQLQLAVTAEFQAMPGLQYARFYDVNTVLNQAIASPATFGFTDVVDRCTVPLVVGKAICATPNAYLFWDGTHPTTAGHAAVAAAVLSLLPH